MKRRAILAASGAWLALAATRSSAQASRPPHRIAVLLAGTRSAFRPRAQAFRDELKRLGYVEGKDVQLDIRYAEDRTEKLTALATELVALRPAVIVTHTSAGIAACMKATSTIPIVFATGGSPVEQGFVLGAASAERGTAAC